MGNGVTDSVMPCQKKHMINTLKMTPIQTLQLRPNGTAKSNQNQIKFVSLPKHTNKKIQETGVTTILCEKLQLLYLIELPSAVGEMLSLSSRRTVWSGWEFYAG